VATDSPPREVTDEASERGLALAKQAGDAYREMVDYFIGNVATSGAKQNAGDYLIGVAVEEAEPLWQMLGGSLELKEPMADANAHLEVVVADRADGRFIPGLDVHVTLLDESGDEVGTYELPFLWHPTMYHYGRSIHVQQGGTYTMRVHVEAPGFPRHDKVNGKRYSEPVTCEFGSIRIERGRKT
jgi:hypothetical protein